MQATKLEQCAVWVVSAVLYVLVLRVFIVPVSVLCLRGLLGLFNVLHLN